MASEDRSHPHLQVAREQPVPERRPPDGYPRVNPPDDPQAHSERLEIRLRSERETTPTDLGGYDERRLIKISLNQKISPEDVAKAAGGVEIVSQERGTLVLAFASEAQLEAFEARLINLAAGHQVTYKHFLFALQDFDRWTRDDRTGFALSRHGFPATAFFLIDAELWPLGLHPDVDRQRSAFEDWVSDNGGTVLDSVRQPYLTLYRIRCSRRTADRLLDHRDVRTVDLPPHIGLGALPPRPGHSGTAASAFSPTGRSRHRRPRHGSGHGTSAAGSRSRRLAELLGGCSSRRRTRPRDLRLGIALYGDVAQAQRERKFVPQLRLFSGRILGASSEGHPELIENQVERAVRYFVDAYGCRVFNLSYGNPHKPYHGRHVAGLAVTLDALSRELNVLFVVPTGNFEGDEDGPENWREEYPDYLMAENARLLDPAPALNALTVGSLARHERNERWPDDASYRPVARAGQPSPFTRRGPSVSGALKPDLVDYGGNSAVMGGAGDHLLPRAPGLGELSISHRFGRGRPLRRRFRHQLRRAQSCERCRQGVRGVPRGHSRPVPCVVGCSRSDP